MYQRLAYYNYAVMTKLLICNHHVQNFETVQYSVVTRIESDSTLNLTKKYYIILVLQP